METGHIDVSTLRRWSYHNERCYVAGRGNAKSPRSTTKARYVPAGPFFSRQITDFKRLANATI